MSPIREALDRETNSPQQHLRECIGNSMENMYSDVRVEMVNIVLFHVADTGMSSAGWATGLK